MLFATLILEEQFAGFSDLWPMFQNWLTVVGGLGLIVAAAMLIRDGIRYALGKPRWYLAEGFAGRLPGHDPIARFWRVRTFWMFHLIAVIGLLMLLIGIRFVVQTVTESAQEVTITTFEPRDVFYWGMYVALGAGVMILSWEFFLDLFELRPRRIWAIARLSIKEAIRRKALLSFLLLLGIFLFASWFIQADQPRNQWRIYVSMVFFVMTALLLLTSGVLACFSLPTDIRNQTIHTIVTKPVQKFEIVLGRILGYTLLMTVVLVLVSLVSLIYVVREIDERARSETMKARRFVTGDLTFEANNPESGRTERKKTGEPSGRVWQYRSYIRGGSEQAAVWEFSAKDLKGVRDLKRVPVEFSFDISRMSRGGGRIAEQGVQCMITVQNTGNPKFLEYLQTQAAVAYDEETAKKSGYFQLDKPRRVFDERSTDSFTFPVEVLEGVENGKLEIRVTCHSPGQYLGMAKHDLYIRAGEDNFILNYLKGSFGIWFIMFLVIGVGVVVSTYLSAMVAILFTFMLMLCGLPGLRRFISEIASGKMAGGGPGEAAYRLFRQDNLTTPLEGGAKSIESVDAVFQFIFSGFVRVLPDLRQFDRSMFVAEGFSIPGLDLVLNAILVLGYLFPFLLLGYYLLNAREVAGAT